MKIEEYQQINQSFEKQRLVFHFGVNAGFYSEFNNMVLGIAYCLAHGIRFQIYSADAVFRIDKGWNDYFRPFCEERQCFVHHYINKRANQKKTGRQKLYRNFNKIFNPGLFLTSDVWYDIRELDKTILDTSFRFLFPSARSLQDICAEIIQCIYHFNNETERDIQTLLSKIDIKGEYVGFHIRGGDKFLEHKILNINEYLKKAESVTDIRQAYVFTDDYSIYELLCTEYPGWKFHTLAQKEDEGYFHKQFVKLPVEVRKAKMVYMFASIEMLSRAYRTFCTYSSNVGMFLGMRNSENVCGIDFEDWRIW